MAGVRIDVDDAAVRAALQRLLAAGQRPRPALLKVGELLVEAAQGRFREQRGPDGQAWAPLSPAYAKRKAKKGRDPSIVLVLNRYLVDTLRYQVQDDELLVGTDRPYGAVHQLGHPEKNIPARPYLGLSSDDRARVLEVFNDYLEDAVSG